MPTIPVMLCTQDCMSVGSEPSIAYINGDHVVSIVPGVTYMAGSEYTDRATMIYTSTGLVYYVRPDDYDCTKLAILFEGVPFCNGGCRGTGAINGGRDVCAQCGGSGRDDIHGYDPARHHK